MELKGERGGSPRWDGIRGGIVRGGLGKLGGGRKVGFGEGARRVESRRVTVVGGLGGDVLGLYGLGSCCES